MNAWMGRDVVRWKVLHVYLKHEQDLTMDQTPVMVVLVFFTGEPTAAPGRIMCHEILSTSHRCANKTTGRRTES